MKEDEEKNVVCFEPISVVSYETLNLSVICPILEDTIYSEIGHITDKFKISYNITDINSKHATFFSSSSFKSILIGITDKLFNLNHAIKLEETFGEKQ